MLNRFYACRERLSTLASILIVVGSFTFFSILAVSATEKNWIARFEERNKDQLNLVDNQRRKLVAAVWLRDLLTTIPIDTKTNLSLLWKELAGDRRATEELATSIAESISKVEPKPDQLADAEKTANNVPKELSVRELAELLKASQNVEPLLKEENQTVMELVKSALGEILPKTNQNIVDEFISSLIGAIAEITLSNVFPNSVEDEATARDWLKRFVGITNTKSSSNRTPFDFISSSQYIRSISDSEAKAKVAVSRLIDALEARKQRKEAKFRQGVKSLIVLNQRVIDEYHRKIKSGEIKDSIGKKPSP